MLSHSYARQKIECHLITYTGSIHQAEINNGVVVILKCFPDTSIRGRHFFFYQTKPTEKPIFDHAFLFLSFYI